MMYLHLNIGTLRVTALSLTTHTHVVLRRYCAPVHHCYQGVRGFVSLTGP